MSTYTLQLYLAANAKQRRELNHRFFLAQKVYNCMVKEARRRVNAYFLDKEVKVVRMRRRKKGYSLTAADKSVLNRKRDQYGLDEYAFHAYLTPQQQKYSGHLDANTVQKIGTAVWRSTSDFLFGKGKVIRLKTYDRLYSLEGKTDRSGIRFREGKLKWLGLVIPVRVRANDLYAQRALCDHVKYCRIVRRWHKNGFRYYLQLVLDGTPPTKKNRSVKRAKGGVDLGASTIAAVSSKGIIFQELGAGIDTIEREIAALNRKLDRQRRASNPQNYDAKGRIKRLRKGERRMWHYSAGYYKTRNKLRSLYAKRSSKLKQAHDIQANGILENVGDMLYVENMSLAGLSRRSKKDKINPRTGRPYSKKRFGKTLQNHAPGQFIETLTSKARAVGGDVIKVNPQSIKASQYNHISDTYQKPSLQERWKELQPGDMVQRDLYSAYLLSNLDQSHSIDRDACRSGYPNFKSMHDSMIETLRLEKTAGKRFPSCMGI